MRLAVLLVTSVTASFAPGCTDSDEHAEDGALFEAAYEEGLEPGKEDGTDCSGVRVPDRSGFAKRVALTFDDGPNPDTTPALLDFLAEHDVRAVFCVIGRNIVAPGGAAILERIVADGHVLGNHSTDYVDLG
ncbi:MAG TPA: polysaccharide deacetylase family protein, partial [Kofleriaceae bacterium]